MDGVKVRPQVRPLPCLSAALGDRCPARVVAGLTTTRDKGAARLIEVIPAAAQTVGSVRTVAVTDVPRAEEVDTSAVVAGGAKKVAATEEQPRETVAAPADPKGCHLKCGAGEAATGSFGGACIGGAEPAVAEAATPLALLEVPAPPVGDGKVVEPALLVRREPGRMRIIGLEANEKVATRLRVASSP